jgi:hypothetical protein
MKTFVIPNIIPKIKKNGKELNFLSKKRPKIKNKIKGKAIKKPSWAPKLNA